MPDHAIFMGAFYLALIIIGAGVGYVVLKSIKDTASDSNESHGHQH
jgi:Na+(H+)/acetate symporter ActP